MSRYETHIWDPDKNAYTLYGMSDHESDDEAREYYRTLAERYKSEPRHQMIKPPKIIRIDTVRTEVPWERGKRSS